MLQLDDFVPLVVVSLLSPWPPAHWWQAFAGYFALAWLLGRVFWRVWRRHDECVRHGHDPYRPVPHIADYRCWHCGVELCADELPHAADEATGAPSKPSPQAAYSDRR